MVIFHSYVSLPEGKSYPEWCQTSPFCGDERLGAVTVRWLAAESPTCCEWWWWTFPGPSHWTRILKCCRYYLKTVGSSMYICICANIYIYIYVDIIHVYVYTVHACMCRESIHFFRVCSNDSLLPSRRSSARPCHLWTYPAIGPPQRQAADVPSEGTKLPSFLSRAAVVRYCCQ